MQVEDLERNWDEFGRTDPFWAVLTQPDKRGNKWDAEEFYATGRDEVASVMKRVRAKGLSPAGCALDFGSGAGRLSQALTGYFASVTGVDVAQSMVDVASARNPHGDMLRFVHNPNPDLRIFADGTFDFILSLITLQHTAPDLIEGYVREFARVVKRGGIVVFDLPDPQNPRVPLKTRIRNALPPGILAAYHVARHGRRLPIVRMDPTGPIMHLCGVGPDKVKGWLASGGLSVIECSRPDSQDPLTAYFYIAQKHAT